MKYGLNELEPVMSKELMEFHYGKHHQTYVNNCNASLPKLDAGVKSNVHVDLSE